MTDVHDPETRKKNMSAIKGKNTKPEIQIRKLLYSNGFRYRVNVNTLPGKPDIVLPKYHVVIQINGCFWHGHGCALFKWPSTRAGFWKKKIIRTMENDRKNIFSLQHEGWRVLTIWECALKGKNKLETNDLANKIISFIKYEDESWKEISGSIISDDKSTK